MARREKYVTCEAEGRDKGKRYHLQEMSAARAEEWAVRAILAVAAAGVEVPVNMRNAGVAGLLQLGLQSLVSMKFSEAKPLLAELMDCVTFCPDKRAGKENLTRKLIDDDTEEVMTRYWLREQVLDLHTGFSVAAYLQGQAAVTTTEPTTSAT